jgi:hypothetical protein
VELEVRAGGVGDDDGDPGTWWRFHLGWDCSTGAGARQSLG